MSQSLKQKLEVHDYMMALHRCFMRTAISLKTKVDDERKKDVDELIDNMKSLAQLVDKALEVSE